MSLVRKFLLVIFYFLFCVVQVIGQFKSDWKRSVFGGSNGLIELIVADINNDGKDEILSNATIPGTGLTNFWQILEHNGQDFQMEQTFVSDIILNFPTKNAHTIQNGLHYYVHSSSLDFNQLFPIKLSVWQIDTKEKIIDKNFSRGRSWIVDDYDNDGKKDFILFTIDNSLEVYTFPEMKFQYESNFDHIVSHTTSFIDFDNDGQKELLIEDFNTFHILKKVSGVWESFWDMNEYAFGNYGAISYGIYDFNKDGDNEIIAVLSDSMRVFDPSTKSQILKLADTRRPSSFVIGPWGKENELIMVAKTNWAIETIDPYTFETIKSIPDKHINQAGPYKIKVCDINGDSSFEAIWTDGRDNSGCCTSRFFVQNIYNEDEAWASYRQNIYLENFKIDTFLANKKLQLVHTLLEESTSWQNSKYTKVYDTETNTLLSDSTVGFYNFEPIQWDNDLELEILNYSTDNVFVYDFPSNNIVFSKYFSFPASVIITQVKQYDIDKDGTKDFIAILKTVGASDQGASYIIVFDDRFEIKFQLPHLFSNNFFIGNYHFEIANVDSDPQEEIVSIIADNGFQYFGIVIWDIENGEYTIINYDNHPIVGLGLYDLDNNGKFECYLGTINGIDVWDLEALQIKEEIKIEEDNGYFPLVENIIFHDFDKDNKSEMVVTHDGMIKVININNQEVIWKSRFLGTILAPNNSLKVVNTKNQSAIYAGTEYTLEKFIYIGTSTLTKNIDEYNVKIYPNPTSDILNVEMPDDSINKFAIIIDQNGIILKQISLNFGLSTIDISRLKPGLYYLNIIDNHDKTIGWSKFIKIAH